MRRQARAAERPKLTEDELLALRAAHIQADIAWREARLRDECMEQALRVVEKRGDPADVAMIAAEIEKYRRGEE